MDPRVLRTFVAVAEQRHFARAASLCNLSQPAVSHQIALLEEEVGARLLNRASRRVSLTVAGEVLLEEARRILAAVDRAHERMQEVARGAVGRIRLGATQTPALYVLPPLLAEYRRTHDTFDLRLEIAPVHELVERVARNNLDMAVVVGHPPTTELQMRPLSADELILVAHPDAPIVGTRSVKPAQLESETWLIREEGSETRRSMAAWWHRWKITPPRTMTFHGPDALKCGVMSALGIAMVSRRAVEEDLAKRRLARIRIAAPLPEREFFVIDHPQKHHGAACRAMLHLFEKCFPRTFSATPRAGRRPRHRTGGSPTLLEP